MAAEIASLVQEAIDRTGGLANGLAVIVANAHSSEEATKLSGVRKDLEEMKRTFEELRFATFPIYDATAQQIRDIVKAVTAPEIWYPRSFKRFAFVFAGHGGEDVIHTHTESLNLQNEIILPFQPMRARQIGAIPKLFFIDACRGDHTDKGVEVPIPRGSNSQSLKIPSNGNCLVAFSTVSSMKSFEHDGGLWMQEVAKLLREEKGSVVDVLQMANKSLMDLFNLRGYPDLQQPIFHSSLNTDPIKLREEADELNRRSPGICQYYPPNDEQQTYSGVELELQLHKKSESPPHHLQQGGEYRRLSNGRQMSRHEFALSGGAVDTSAPLLAHSTSQSPHQNVLLQPMATAPYPFAEPNPAFQFHPLSSTNAALVTSTIHVGEGATPPSFCLPPSSFNGFQLRPPQEPYTNTAGFFHSQEQQHPHHTGATIPPQPQGRQFELIEDHSSGQSRYKCTIKSTGIDGCPRRNTGGYHASIESAMQEAEKKLTARTFFAGLQSRGVTGATQDHKTMLKQYFIKVKGIPCPSIKYTNKESRGYQSKVFAPGMGYVEGKRCGSKEEAQQSAAWRMLQQIRKYSD